MGVSPPPGTCPGHRAWHRDWQDMSIATAGVSRTTPIPTDYILVGWGEQNLEGPPQGTQAPLRGLRQVVRRARPPVQLDFGSPICHFPMLLGGPSLHFTAGETEAQQVGTHPSLASARCHQHPPGIWGSPALTAGCPSPQHSNVEVGCDSPLHMDNPSGLSSMHSVTVPSLSPEPESASVTAATSPAPPMDSSIPGLLHLADPWGVPVPTASSLHRVTPI